MIMITNMNMRMIMIMNEHRMPDVQTYIRCCFVTMIC